MSKLILGQWNAICDRCGQKYKASQLRKDWQGLMVCHDDWEPRNEQDFLRVRSETGAPEWVRPEPEDVFNGPVCDLAGASGVANYAVADCARADFDVDLGILIDIYGVR